MDACTKMNKANIYYTFFDVFTVNSIVYVQTTETSCLAQLLVRYGEIRP